MIKRDSLRESTHPLPWVSLKLILTHYIKNTAFRATENIFLGWRLGIYIILRDSLGSKLWEVTVHTLPVSNRYV